MTARRIMLGSTALIIGLGIVYMLYLMSLGATFQSDPAPTVPVLTRVPDTISRADLGDAWPLTVDAGVLGCLQGAVIFSTSTGTYAVNGTAKANKAWLPIDSIWADDPAIPGTKKNIGPLLDRGLALCK